MLLLPNVFAESKGEACLVCRRKKMRCDAVKPACGPCSRAGRGQECEYEHTRFLTQISGLETQLASQQKRIQELESLLHPRIDNTPEVVATPAPAPAPIAVPSTAGASTHTPYLPTTFEPPLRLPPASLPYELSPEQITQLAALFLPHGLQFGLPLSQLSSLPIALRARNCPLSEAIFACAAFFAPVGSPWAGYHPLFFDRADRALVADDIDIIHKVQAHSLLATLAFVQAYAGNSTSWLPRGHRNAAAAVHVACAQNWHRETSTAAEHETWWMVYALDRTWGPVHGVSSAPRDAQISTPLPGPAGTLSLLYESCTHGIHEAGETPESIRIKALALRGRAYDVITSYSPHRHIPQSYWSNFYCTLSGLSRLASLRLEGSALQSPGTAGGKIILHTTRLALHALINDREPALSEVVDITTILLACDEESFQTLDPIVWVCLHNVQQFLEKDQQIYDVDDRVREAIVCVKLSLEKLCHVYRNVDCDDSAL